MKRLFDWVVGENQIASILLVMGIAVVLSTMIDPLLKLIADTVAAYTSLLR